MSSGPPKFVYSTSTNCRKTLVSAKPHISRITDSLELPETTFESQVIRLFSCNRLRISQMIRCVWCITESSNPPPPSTSLLDRICPGKWPFRVIISTIFGYTCTTISSDFLPDIPASYFERKFTGNELFRISSITDYIITLIQTNSIKL